MGTPALGLLEAPMDSDEVFTPEQLRDDRTRTFHDERGGTPVRPNEVRFGQL